MSEGDKEHNEAGDDAGDGGEGANGKGRMVGEDRMGRIQSRKEGREEAGVRRRKCWLTVQVWWLLLLRCAAYGEGTKD